MWLSQSTLRRYYNSEKAKLVSTPLSSSFRMSVKQSSSNDKEKKHMQKVPYVSIVDSLMYIIVCTRLDIAHAVSVSRFLCTPNKEHWNVVK